MENRRMPRLPWKSKVLATQITGTGLIAHEAQLTNISKKGFAIVTEESFVPGKIYNFTVSLNGNNVRMDGKVVRQKRNGTYGTYGVRVENVAFTHRGIFNRFLAANSEAWHTRFVVYSLIGAAVVFAVLKWGVGATVLGSATGAFIGFLVFFALLPF